jgi:hypothetical protein
MGGLAGRKGWGFVIPAIPTLGRPRVPPPLTTLDAVGRGARGWIAATLHEDAGGLALHAPGAQSHERLPVKLDRCLPAATRPLVAMGVKEVFAFTHRAGDRLVCDRIVYVPERAWRRPNFFALAAAQCVLLLAIAGGVTYVFVKPLFASPRPAAADHAGPPTPSTPPRGRPGRPKR